MFLVCALRFLVFSFLLKRSNGTRSNITKFLRLYFAHEPAYNLVPLSRYVHGESILDEDQWHAYISWVFPDRFLPSRLHGRSLKPSLLLQYRLTGWLFFWGNQEHLNLLKVSLMYVTLHESPTAGHFQHLLQRTSILNMQFGVGWGWVCSSQNVSVSYALLGYPYLEEHPAFQVTSDTVCIQKDVHVRMYVLKDLRI